MTVFESLEFQNLVLSENQIHLIYFSVGYSEVSNTTTSLVGILAVMGASVPSPR